MKASDTKIYGAAYGIVSISRILSEDGTEECFPNASTLNNNISGGLMKAIEILADQVMTEVEYSNDDFMFEDVNIRVSKNTQSN